MKNILFLLLSLGLFSVLSFMAQADDSSKSTEAQRRELEKATKELEKSTGELRDAVSQLLKELAKGLEGAAASDKAKKEKEELEAKARPLPVPPPPVKVKASGNDFTYEEYSALIKYKGKRTLPNSIFIENYFNSAAECIRWSGAIRDKLSKIDKSIKYIHHGCKGIYGLVEVARLSEQQLQLVEKERDKIAGAAMICSAKVSDYLRNRKKSSVDESGYHEDSSSRSAR